MKYIKKNTIIIFIISFFTIYYSHIACPQDNFIIINSKILNPHERPLVKFDHTKHMVNIKCITCHHNYDQYFNLIEDSEGITCSECHKTIITNKNKTTLITAFHKQCKSCHYQTNIKEKISPTMCGDCHKK